MNTRNLNLFIQTNDLINGNDLQKVLHKLLYLFEVSVTPISFLTEVSEPLPTNEIAYSQNYYEKELTKEKKKKWDNGQERK